jgi:hypothetical protein
MSRVISPQAHAFLRAEFAMNLGRGFLLMAFTLQLYRSSGDIWHNLVYVASEGVCAFFVPLFAANCVNRLGPSRLVSVCALAAAGVIAALGAAVWFAGPQADVLLAASVLIAMLNAAIRIAVFALVPALVQASGLADMNGRHQLSFQSGHLIGVSLAGVAMDHLGLGPSLLGVALVTVLASQLYGLAGAGLAAVLAGQGPVAGHHLRGFLRMLAPVIGSPMMVWIIVLGAADLIVVALFNLALPILIERNLPGHSSAVSVAGVFFALGAIALGAVVTRRDLDIPQLHGALLLMPVATLLTMLQLKLFSIYVYYPLALVMGAGTALHAVYFTTMLQGLVAPHLRAGFAAVRRMTSATLVGGCSSAFAAAYAHGGLDGACVAAAAVCAGIGLSSAAWVFTRANAARGRHADLPALFTRIAYGAPSAGTGSLPAKPVQTP